MISCRNNILKPKQPGWGLGTRVVRRPISCRVMAAVPKRGGEAGRLTCVYLALEIDLLPLRVGAGRDVHSRHVPPLPGLADGRDVANQGGVI